MADTKALRHRIEEQIKSLQEKLHAIDLVEQMSKELGVDGEKLKQPSGGWVPISFANRSVAEACKLLVAESEDKTWTVAEVLKVVQSRGIPAATRQAVAVALRRLEKSGSIAFRKLSGRRVGYTAKTLHIDVHN